MTHQGSCLCGTVKFEIRGDFQSLYLCHCVYCQKDTGSAHAANLFSKSAELVWLQGADAVTSYRLPDSRHNKCFCKVCGSALPSTQIEGLLLVPAGCLDTEVAITAKARLYTARRPAWDLNSGDAPEFEGMPG
tara:strand:- start:267 stop:665 length:399 start_codon:yes stop_codon:yes gene_type:complete